jgi:phosphoribosylformylglycinamidine synthase
MLILPGASALSGFRIQRLLAQLQKIEPNVTGVAARYLHFVDTSDNLDAGNMAILKELLDHDSSVNLAEYQGAFYTVVPRVGTISSWSSKATEIVQRCGLNTVKRVER